MRHAHTLLQTARKLRQDPPLAWLLTDARAGDPLPVLARLPRSVGLIIRHYDAADRRVFAHKLVALCRRHRRVVLVAGDAQLALRLRADGVHWPEGLVRPQTRPKGPWLVSAAAHGRTGLIKAQRAGVDQVLLSPLFPTRSHPGAPTLGCMRAGLLIRGIRLPIIGLGGVTAKTGLALVTRRFAGLAAIDGWIEPGCSPQ
jgi:thiamine-phosphate pyrophosphorylase